MGNIFKNSSTLLSLHQKKFTMKYAVPDGNLVQEKLYSVLASVMLNECIWQILRSLVMHNDTERLKQTIKYILTVQVQLKFHTEQVHISF